MTNCSIWISNPSAKPLNKSRATIMKSLSGTSTWLGFAAQAWKKKTRTVWFWLNLYLFLLTSTVYFITYIKNSFLFLNIFFRVKDLDFPSNIIRTICSTRNCFSILPDFVLTFFQLKRHNVEIQVRHKVENPSAKQWLQMIDIQVREINLYPHPSIHSISG